MHNDRLTPNLEEINTIPEEIIEDRRSQASTHLVLDKKLILDVANAQKLLMILIYADATNYYHRVVYHFLSICIHYFRLELSFLIMLLRIVLIVQSESCYLAEKVVIGSIPVVFRSLCIVKMCLQQVMCSYARYE